MAVGTTTDQLARSASRDLPVPAITGWAGLIFFVLIVAQNAVRSSGPLNGADSASVLAYATNDSAALTVLLGLYPIGLLSLIVFGTGLRRLAQAAGGTPGWLADIGLVGLILIAALFGISNLIEAALVSVAPALAGSPALVSAIWALHGAAFALNLAAIGVTLAGLSQAAARANLAPGWTGTLGLIGAVLLVAGAIPVVAVTGGSALFAVGLAGFLCWVVWLAICAGSLIRSSRPA